MNPLGKDKTGVGKYLTPVLFQMQINANVIRLSFSFPLPFTLGKLGSVSLSVSEASSLKPVDLR